MRALIDEQLHAYSMGLLQGKAYSRVHASVSHELLAFEISVPEWKLLGQLYDEGAIKLSNLADLLSYDQPMVTKLVKQLEKKNLVLRAQDTIDERAKIITITAAGKTLIEKAEPKVKSVLKDILQGITREDLLTYLKVLTVITKNTQV